MESPGPGLVEVIPHIDDIGVTLGSVRAMEELAGRGFVTSGSVMAPCPWLAEAASLAARFPQLDLGLHLTLTSESARLRWRPLSTRSPASGLVDGDGFMWPAVPQLRARAQPAAVEEELETQIESARRAGIDPTHLDHHMGAAFAPEFAPITMGVARRHRLPVLIPADVVSYAAVLDWGEADLGALEGVRDGAAAEGAVLMDRFLMGLAFQDQDPDSVYRRFLTEARGVTFLSMHCNAPGEVTAVHPGDADWRIAEYDWIKQGAAPLPPGVELTDFRAVGARWRWPA